MIGSAVADYRERLIRLLTQGASESATTLYLMHVFLSHVFLMHVFDDFDSEACM
jgi:hypothetical protein